MRGCQYTLNLVTWQCSKVISGSALVLFDPQSTSHLDPVIHPDPFVVFSCFAEITAATIFISVNWYIRMLNCMKDVI